MIDADRLAAPRNFYDGNVCAHVHLSETFTWMNDLWKECLDCGHMNSPSWFVAKKVQADGR